MHDNVFIVGAARTPIGKFGGGLAHLNCADLGAIPAAAAIERAKVSADDIGSVVVGNVIPTRPEDVYLSRMVGRQVGVPDSAAAFNVNRLCGSGAQAIVSAALEIAHKVADFALAGGVESMSNAPYSVDGLRFGTRMGDGVNRDWMLGTLNCPFDKVHMGVTAENIAAEKGISRQQQDEFAVISQDRAAQALATGLFDAETIAVGDCIRDEHPRPTSVEKLSQLRPAFKTDGTVTAGNSSGINDGAAFVVLASESAVAMRNLNPLARIAGWAVAGVPPRLMGLGPIPAVPKALAAAGIKLADVGVIESNEAFAAQNLAVSQELGFDPELVNPNGGAIALGHPLGATGAVLTVKAIYHMQRNNLRYGLVTMCIGGGQGIALVLENPGVARG